MHLQCAARIEHGSLSREIISIFELFNLDPAASLHHLGQAPTALELQSCSADIKLQHRPQGADQANKINIPENNFHEIFKTLYRVFTRYAPESAFDHCDGPQIELLSSAMPALVNGINHGIDIFISLRCLFCQSSHRTRPNMDALWIAVLCVGLRPR